MAIDLNPKSKNQESTWFDKHCEAKNKYDKLGGIEKDLIHSVTIKKGTSNEEQRDWFHKKLKYGPNDQKHLKNFKKKHIELCVWDTKERAMQNWN